MESRDLEDLLEELFSKIRPEVAPGEADGSEGDDAAPPTGPSNSGQEGWEQGPIRISLDAVEQVNYAMLQNGVPILRRMVVKNDSSTSMRMVKIEISLDAGNLTENEFAVPLVKYLDQIEPGQEVAFHHLPMKLELGAMSQLVEETKARLIVEATLEEKTVGRWNHDLDLLAFNQWNARHPARQILAAHVQPNHPAVLEILQRTGELLEKKTGSSSIEDYQSGRERALQIVEAIYQALAERGISYITVPGNVHETGQKIRTPDQVLDDKQGTCLDLACVAASCLEQAGLHAVIYVINGHAYPGAFLEEMNAPLSVVDEVGWVLNVQDQGHLIPFDAVSFTTGSGESFAEACQRGVGNLSPPSRFNYLVDIRFARTEKITPLPGRRRDKKGELVVIETQIVIDSSPSFGGGEAGESGEERFKEKKELPSRIRKWQRDLLDLTLRNPLLNFRPQKSALRLHVPSGALGVFEDFLAEGADLTLLPFDQAATLHDDLGARGAQQLIDRDQCIHFLNNQRMLFVAHDNVQATRRMKTLFRKAKTLEEETGSNHLYAVLGVLHWKEGAKDVASPLILVPARLSKPSKKRDTMLSADIGAEAEINFCLVRKMEQDFGIDLRELETPKLDAHGVDVAWVLSTTRETLMESGHAFSVEESAHLAVLSFGKYQLWHDLEHRSHELMDNPVVRHLVETPNLPYDDPKGRAEESTVDLESEEANCPLPCDSSQLNAVIEAGKGRSFVLQGPPGTGKSQTITNLVAHCLALGKKVLFVAEKAAALHVVKRRLDKVGLGASCLELHSKATSLPAVRRQFEEALDLKPGQDPEDWERDQRNYGESRERLSGYVGALHDPMPIGLSPYWAQERKTKLGAGREAAVPAKFLERGKEDCAAVLDLLKEAEGAGKDAGAQAGHPWSISRLLTLDGFDEQQWGELTSRMEGVLKEPLLEGLTGLETLEGSCDLPLLKQLQDLLTLDGRGLLPEESTVDAFNRPAWAAAVQAVFESLKRLEDARNRVEEGYELESLEDEDLADLLAQAKRASTSWPVLKWLRFRPVIARMQQCAREGHRVRARPVEADIKAARKIPRVQDELRSLISDVPSPGFPFGDVAGRPEVITKAREGHEAALTVAALTKGIVADAVRAYLKRPLGAEANIRAENIAELHDVFSGICALLQSDRPAQISWRADKSLLDAIRASLQEWRGSTAIHSLRRWTTFWGLLDKVSGHGLEDFALAVAGGEVELGDIRECFMRGLSARLVDHALSERSALRGFDDKAHTRELNRFKELDAKIAEGYYQVVPRILYESRPRGLKDTALKELGQVGLLRRWVERKRGGDTVRKVLEQWPGAVTVLKPCFLMSPASVAQYLPVDTEGKGMHFDVVIFDEASQIPVPDAIGAVARGKSLVVVGDSKQMPPTAFFKAADDEDSELGPDLLVEDAESILTECEQANLPALWLNWHYRSRHESLIAFSNAHYYEGRLTSFPSPHKTSDRYGVSFHKVEEGYYDTGKTRTNPPEADAIVQEIVRMCAHPVECKRSIGVVTFNMQQQELVLDKLEDKAESNPALKAAMDGDGVEPLFVKNLENVQGDERDIILFSICYGPTKEGRAPSMNFGPLNRAGGERRLNVAVTRAREKVQVFATLLPGMIDLSRTNSIGAAHLKAFLEMAQKGTSGEVSSQAAQGCDKDAYRAEIAAALRGRGLIVREQLGMSEFKVDLALGVDESAEVFRAAVLLDGPGYRDLPTTRDRDSIPPLMLEDLGWAIYRIWLPAWIHERDRLLDEIVELVRTPAPVPVGRPPLATAPEIPAGLSTDDAVGSHVDLEGSAGESTSTIEDPPDSEPEPTGASMYEGGELFVPFEGGRALGTKEDFELGAGIENGVREVLAVEGPVQADRLGQLVARRFGFKRVQSARVKTVLDHLPARARRHRSSFGEFIWPEDKAPDSWAGFRYSVGRGERSVDELAAEEVRNLMLQATRESLGLSRSELLRLCADVFSLGNLGKKIVARLDSILERALDEGVLVDQGGVIVPSP